MKSFSKAALLALALYTAGTAQAQVTPAKTKTQAPAAVKNYYVVQLSTPSEPLTAQEETSLNKLRTANKGKKVEVFSMRWSSNAELRGILGKFFGKNVQVDAGNEHSFTVNGKPLELNSGKATLLIADDQLLMATVGKSDDGIANFLASVK